MATAVITGASGLLGANLAIELLGRGHRVRATSTGTTWTTGTVHAAFSPVNFGSTRLVRRAPACDDRSR